MVHRKGKSFNISEYFPFPELLCYQTVQQTSIHLPEPGWSLLSLTNEKKSFLRGYYSILLPFRYSITPFCFIPTSRPTKWPVASTGIWSNTNIRHVHSCIVDNAFKHTIHNYVPKAHAGSLKSSVKEITHSWRSIQTCECNWA